ncbi:hypothetical protein A1F94_006154 [Pyrenophora tritici-repentis]|uniref:Uncharacterized protein n=1 Tax=Pyrenophora tritici-repentis TaxID=45151 RepID=A0A317A6I1_9PLEO|nr:hypothetical protein A1F99_058550 [Pyrenophora tritici-repentis]KAF7571188.1 hypothetical protein PtrM4_111900 [Pyrenophora tritici-repentis]KAG9384243.1 hypothetical protein A1F94_006154 [Pyrenophora tritici-repentis]KAI1682325.1 hypothetical protein KJE20_07057 [Pyrenophora tritici-repentis]
MLEAANPDAARAIWTSRTSVARYVFRVYDHLKPRIIMALSQSLSKIHISFDSWTTKGSKRGFLGVVAHFVNTDGKLVDLPIALPQLTGAHSGANVTVNAVN